MASTVFTDFVTPVPAAWLNDVNTATYVTVPTTLPASVTAETNARIAADNLLAPKDSPTLTGVPTAPTAAAGTNTTQIATTAFSTLQDLGVGQTTVSYPMTSGTIYTNNTAKPWYWSATMAGSASDTFSIGAYTSPIKSTSSTATLFSGYIIPPGSTFSFSGTALTFSEMSK